MVEKNNQEDNLDKKLLPVIQKLANSSTDALTILNNIKEVCK